MFCVQLLSELFESPEALQCIECMQLTQRIRSKSGYICKAFSDNGVFLVLGKGENLKTCTRCCVNKADMFATIFA